MPQPTFTQFPAREAWLRALSPEQLKRQRREAAKALRTAWPHRHTSFRAPIVIRANLQMLADVGALLEEVAV